MALYTIAVTVEVDDQEVGPLASRLAEHAEGFARVEEWTWFPDASARRVEQAFAKTAGVEWGGR